MKGIVIHYQGKVRRALEGRGNCSWLDIRVINPVPLNQETAALGCVAQRPLYFVFNFNGRPFAASQNVVLTKGRRYAGVEHWFIMPERKQQSEIHKPQQTSAAPA